MQTIDQLAPLMYATTGYPCAPFENTFLCVL